MTGAMYAAVAGLKAHMTALNVIGHNISNVNTNGYKAARYTFNEALYTTSRSGSNGSTESGGVNPAQIGYGSSIGTIDLDMSTKSYNPTGIMTDCMIDGDGFFILGDKTKATGITKQTELQGMNLSRLGNFGFDPEGWLADGNGSVVYGFLCTGYNAQTAQYEFSPTLTAIRLPQSSDTKVNVLDDDGNVVGTRVKTNVYYPSVNSSGETVDGAGPKLNEDGTALESAPGYTEQQLTDINNATADDPDQTNYTLKQQLMAEAAAQKKSVSLASINIDKTGRIMGVTQDNQQVCVGFVALAKVDNPNGVTHVDGRYYQALGGAGDVHLCSIGGNVVYAPAYDEEGNVIKQQKLNPDGTPVGGEDDPVYNNDVPEYTIEGSGDTELVNGGLEMSGTDLATEISNMIMIQRGYQANTRIVTVTDSMLEELVNMKR